MGDLPKHNWYNLGEYAHTPYEKCPNCGGDVDWITADPEPGDEAQFCIGTAEARARQGPDMEDEDCGCGWAKVMEHHPNVPVDHADHDDEQLEGGVD